MASPKDEFVDANGLRFHYRDWGGSGRPVVLLHGLASNCRIWDLTAPLLAREFRVLALDQRGHGLTDKPENGYDFPSITSDLRAFLQAVRLERPGLVGHSWGANVALQYAADQPDQIAWLALVDGGFLEIAGFPDMTLERALQVMAPPPLAGMELETFLKGASSWPGLGGLWSDQVQDIVLANFHIDDEERIFPHLSRENHLKILRSLWDQRPSAMWSELRCPALLVPASRDHSDPREAVWMDQKRRSIAVAEESAPAVQVLWMEDTIHDVPLHRPEQLAEAIRRFAEKLA